MGAISRIARTDSGRTHERYGVWEGTIPLPPDSLMWSVGGSTLENFLVVADAWSHAMAPYIRPDSTVLDIGSGCGRTARSLVLHPFVSRYIGFDVIVENVEWCRNFIEPRAAGRASFAHYDLYSAEYNPAATMRAAELVFPCDDRSVDLVLAASVFTHLLEPDAVHYLQEIGRVISSRGYAMLSIHTNVPHGTNFSGTEARIDMAPRYFVELAARAGLKATAEIVDLCGQHVLFFSKPS